MATHKQLLIVCKDWEEYKNKDPNNDKPDCSCGCIHFHPLEGDVGFDWGVCCNPQSKRTGLLTFEHMGCDHFESDPNETP